MMEEKILDVDVQLKEEEYFSFSSLVCRKVNQKFFYNFLILGIVFGVLSNTLPDIASYALGTNINHDEVFFIIILIMFLIAVCLLSHKNRKNFLSPNGNTLSPHKFSISENGVSYEGEYYKASSDWRGVLKISEEAGCFYIFIDNMQAYNIPKRCFENEENAQAFLKQARSYWKEATEKKSHHIWNRTEEKGND